VPTLRLQILWILGVVAVVAAYAGVPVSACPGPCEPVPQLVAYTQLPGVTRTDAEKMLAWARSSPCGFCNGRRSVTLLRYTQVVYEGVGRGCW
jgi:hypothetical protein